MRVYKFHLLSMAFALGSLTVASGPARAGNIVLDFSNVPPGTLFVTSPYQDQGFTLSAIDPDNGFPQNFAFHGSNSGFNYAGENGLSAFAPAVITLKQTNGAPFSLLSIDLARNFSFDTAPTVTFTGTYAHGGTVSKTFTVTNPGGASTTFQTFQFPGGPAGFTDLTSVSWDQPHFPPPSGQGLHQFTDITLSTLAGVPEPSSLLLAGLGMVSLSVSFLARRRQKSRPA